MINRLTSTGVSEKLEVPEQTVTQWAECLGIGDPSATGKRLFSQNEMDVIETVKSLREKNHSFDTIARRLKATVLVAEAPAPIVRDPIEGAPPLDMKAITQEVAKAVVEAVQTETQQAEKYARATYLIGQLEEQVKGLEGDLARVQEENRRLKAIAALPWWKALFAPRRVDLVSL